MKYLSVCSGIEAASAAWHDIFTPLAFCEFEAFPSAVLAHHYPTVPNMGDLTKWREWSHDLLADADILVGGTPCQAFSVAGLRNSLDDARGNLSLEFVRLADAIDDVRLAAGKPPSVILWENVPGVLSVKDNAFGCFLAALAGEDTPLVPTGGRWTDAGVVIGPERAVAWRILDAQYFGLAQRRRRVFVVASAREGFDPAAVLLELEGVRRDTAPSREAREIAPTIPSRSTAGGGLGTDFDCDGGVIRAFAGTVESDIAATIQTTCHDYSRADGCNMVAHTLKGEGFDASEDGTGRGTPLVPVLSNDPAHAICANEQRTYTNEGSMFQLRNVVAQHTAYAFQPRIARNGRGDMGEIVNALNAQSGETGKGDAAPCVALSFKPGQSEAAGGTFVTEEFTPTLQAQNNGSTAVPAVMQHMAVRRLTPVECERLQGFPDNYTLIPWRNKPAADCPDGPRYKALGNSMAVPCMRWIGQRIALQLVNTNASPNSGKQPDIAATTHRGT